MDWLTVEVFDGPFSARGWRRSHEKSLVEAAVTHGAKYWEWHDHRWGLLLEIAFADEQCRDGYRALPAVQAALDAAPDPISGVLVYRGRGGGAGAAVPRHPRPRAGAGAIALPEPDDSWLDEPRPPCDQALDALPGLSLAIRG